MDVQFYLVASATKVILAQRMVRKICQNCKTEINLTKDQVESLGVPSICWSNLRAFKGTGCDECGDSGQSGRTAIFEIMPISQAIEKLILDRASDAQIQKTALDEGMYSLRMSAIEKMKQGLVSIDEVFANTASVI